MLKIRGRKTAVISAVVIAAWSVAYAALRPSTPNFMIMGSMLLNSWNMVFTPAPPLRTPMREVYQQARMGAYRTSTTAKLVTVAAAVLFIAGVSLNIAS